MRVRVCVIVPQSTDRCGIIASLRQPVQCLAIFGLFTLANVISVACELQPENGRVRTEKWLQHGDVEGDNGQAREAREHADEWREGIGR